MNSNGASSDDKVDVRDLAKDADASPQATQGGGYGGINAPSPQAAGQPRTSSTGQSVDQHASMSEGSSSAETSGASRQGTMGSRSEQPDRERRDTEAGGKDVGGK